MNKVNVVQLLNDWQKNLKFCKKCQTWKSLKENFYVRKSQLNGKTYSYCNDCNKKMNSDWRRKKHQTHYERRTFTSGLKRCPNCRRNLPLVNYKMRSDRPGQPASYCTPCKNEVSLGRYYRRIGREMPERNTDIHS